LASPAFSGTVSGITKSTVGLGSVDNTSDSVKIVSNPIQTALNLKQNTIVTTETGNVCTSLGNKQRLCSTTDAKLKVQRFEDDGTVASDGWVEQMSLDWNTNTNKSILNLASDLAITGNLSVSGSFTAPNSSATQAAINLNSNSASPSVSGVLSAPQIMFNLSSGPPALTNRSEGAKLVLYPSVPARIMPLGLKVVICGFQLQAIQSETVLNFTEMQRM
jgi:hypothetical protein